jgi:predicted nucleic acid-binding protein
MRLYADTFFYLALFNRRDAHHRRVVEFVETDCISFVVMADEELERALTGDRHFEQAGFKALLL